MIRRSNFAISPVFSAVAVFIFSVVLTGCAGIRGDIENGGSQEMKSSVKHVIFMMQENRSFDHYLGRLNDYRAANGLPRDVDDLTKLGPVELQTWDGTPPVGLYRMNTACTGDLSASWLETHLTIDLENPGDPRNPPPMNGFAYAAGGFAEHDPTFGGFDVTGRRAMGYYDSGHLPFYYWAATQFATSDRWFAAVPARTQPNRMFLLAATSNGHVYPQDLKMDGVKNIFQLLQEAGITWKVYVTDGWSPGNTGSTYMNYFTAFTSQHKDKFVDAKQFAIDAQNGTLPQVAMIESGYIETGTDEHPLNPIDLGAKYVRTLVKALMDSPSWKDSVFFLTYDESGGLYDHVPPATAVNPDGKKPILNPEDPEGDFNITGLRVPLFIFSPFAKPGYVSHTPADFTAILKFIEQRFDLPNLTKRDKAQPSMEEYFNWSTAPNLTSTNPPEQPTLPCYFDRLP